MAGSFARVIYPARLLPNTYLIQYESKEELLYRLHPVRGDGLNSNGSSWEVYIYEGREATRIDVLSWGKRMEASGAREILVASMDRDETKRGY